jgi:hypothetical protein
MTTDIAGSSGATDPSEPPRAAHGADAGGSLRRREFVRDSEAATGEKGTMTSGERQETGGRPPRARAKRWTGASLERRRAGPVARILGFTLIHFSVAVLTALITFGPDLDQLRDRSITSRVAAIAHDILWFPHDVIARALPIGWPARLPAAPLALIGVNSLVWGVAIYLVVRGVSRVRRRDRSSFPA